MRIDWKNVLLLLAIIVLCVGICAVIFGCLWINGEIWLHVSPLASWACAILEILLAILLFSLRKGN